MQPSRRTFVLALAAGALALTGAAGAGSELRTTAPDFSLPLRGGAGVGLAELRGQVVMINFWASWCGPCRESVAALDALALSSGTPVLGVNLDGADRSAAVAESLHLKSPTLVDAQQAVARTYDVAKLPLTLLLDAEGHVRASWSGVPADLADLTPQLKRLRQD